mmetsp:Transcript_4384/g.7415  ORF Transcript_4384/g.7415 Transcript_4384/m.7415 type:complete len:343 (-) Transcript_4384:442-1470(-)
MVGYQESVARGQEFQVREAYDAEEVFENFKRLFEFEESKEAQTLTSELQEGGPEKYEEAKRESLQKSHSLKCGIQLWGLGHNFVRKDGFSLQEDFDDSQDDGDSDEEEDEEESRQNQELLNKIMSDETLLIDQLEPEELEQLECEPILQQAFNNRWYRPENNDTYLVLINHCNRPIQAGKQLFISYRKSNNAQLLENYGFTLSQANKYSSFEFRVTLGTNPKKEVKAASEFLPHPKELEDLKNVDLTTEKMILKTNRVPSKLLQYLRSTLMANNYKGEDKALLMVSSPRVVKFEILVVQFAIDLVQAFCHRNSISDDCNKEREKIFELKKEATGELGEDRRA